MAVGFAEFTGVGGRHVGSVSGGGSGGGGAGNERGAAGGAEDSRGADGPVTTHGRDIEITLPMMPDYLDR